MDLGVLGLAVAERLLAAGFPVRAWTRTGRASARVPVHAGSGGLGAFLGDLAALICLLPLTPQTEGILSADVFGRLPRGAALINVGRGRHLAPTWLKQRFRCRTVGEWSSLAGGAERARVRNGHTLWQLRCCGILSDSQLDFPHFSGGATTNRLPRRCPLMR